MVAAVWSELGRVSIWDLKSHLQNVENRKTVQNPKLKKGTKNKKPAKEEEEQKPLFVFTGHLQEGYAIDWSPTNAGKPILLYSKLSKY